MNFYSDGSLDDDANLPADMFLSYLHYLKKKNMTGAGESDVWGSLVRTYETGDGSQIVDHRTKIMLKNVKSYLNGKIDSLLLERII